jgi:hypothetical protein
MTAGLHLHKTDNEIAVMLPWFSLGYYLGHNNKGKYEWEESVSSKLLQET